MHKTKNHFSSQNINPDPVVNLAKMYPKFISPSVSILIQHFKLQNNGASFTKLNNIFSFE